MAKKILAIDEATQKLKAAESNLVEAFNDMDPSTLADLSDDQLRKLSAALMRVGGAGYQLLAARNEAMLKEAYEMNEQWDLAVSYGLPEQGPLPDLGAVVVTDPPTGEFAAATAEPAATVEPEAEPVVEPPPAKVTIMAIVPISESATE